MRRAIRKNIGIRYRLFKDMQRKLMIRQKNKKGMFFIMYAFSNLNSTIYMITDLWCKPTEKTSYFYSIFTQIFFYLKECNTSYLRKKTGLLLSLE